MTDLSDLTTGEADAWREGWQAAIEAAAGRVEPTSDRPCSCDICTCGDQALSAVQGAWLARLDLAAAIRAIQPPERPSKGETP